MSTADLYKNRSKLVTRLVQAGKIQDDLTSYRIGNLQREIASVNAQIRART